MFEFTYASAEECDYKFVFGDIDGDGAINICDMILLKSYFTENIILDTLLLITHHI